MHQLSGSRRHLRRRERARRRRFVVGACITLVLLAIAVVHLSRVDPIASDSAEWDPVHAVLALSTEAVDAAAVVSDRSRYPYSVIPGGVATVQELERAMAADPVIRTHYADFNLAKTHLVRLTAPRVAHVSYRIENAVFWTRHALLLNEGETLLTDGKHYARTRCGNQLATAPANMSPREPSPESFNTPLPHKVDD